MGGRGREGDVRKVLESLTSFMLSEIEIFPPFSFPSSGKWKIRVHFQFRHEENGILRVNFSLFEQKIAENGQFSSKRATFLGNSCLF